MRFDKHAHTQAPGATKKRAPVYTDLLGGELRKALLVKPGAALAAAAHMWSHEHRPGNTGPLVRYPLSRVPARPRLSERPEHTLRRPHELVIWSILGGSARDDIL